MRAGVCAADAPVLSISGGTPPHVRVMPGYWEHLPCVAYQVACIMHKKWHHTAANTGAVS